jgi:GNAT superfamily N-acetyltransferase/nitroimidazol reductase NimA-like FMN-containing flavoprotein (pyridoxamine 5'-phosphate oxidase superfamily)
MHAVVHDGALWLHGSPENTLADLAGTRVVAEAEEIVARIPSWMRDPQKACPATTYYRSAWVHGTLVPVDDARAKAAMLQHLMEVQQPEGRHLPIDADHPLYRAPVRGLGVWRIDPDSVSAVAKLGQDQSAAHMTGILRGLWTRGDAGDLAAIEEISDAHPARPAFAEVPDGLRPRCHPREADVAQAVALARGRYWNTAFSDADLADAVRHTTAWVGLERDGRLVASARAIADRGKRSWVYDVVVADDRQRTGIGTTLMRLLLDHPAVRRTEVALATRDAAGFYARLGFETVYVDTAGAYPRTTMRRPRSG